MDVDAANDEHGPGDWGCECVLELANASFKKLDKHFCCRCCCNNKGGGNGAGGLTYWCVGLEFDCEGDIIVNTSEEFWNGNSEPAAVLLDVKWRDDDDDIGGCCCWLDDCGQADDDRLTISIMVNNI